MTDPEMLVVMRVLAQIWPPSYFTDFNLTTLAVCRMVNLSLRHGAANTSNQGYALLGWLIGPAFGRFKEGYLITRSTLRFSASSLASSTWQGWATRWD
jgi:predicted ATPase